MQKKLIVSKVLFGFIILLLWPAVSFAQSDACSVFQGASSLSFNDRVAYRIINGSSCYIGDSAVVEILVDGSSSCSGVVIAPRVVLTAAHCTEKGSVDIDDNSKYICQVGNAVTALVKIKDGERSTVEFTRNIRVARKRKRRNYQKFLYFKDIDNKQKKRKKRKRYRKWKRILKGIKNCKNYQSNFLQVQTGGKTVDATDYQGHPDWDSSNYSSAVNDVGVVVVGEDLDTQTMNMLQTNDLTEGEDIAIAGYGINENTSNPSRDLRTGYMILKGASTEEIWADYDGYPADSGSNTCNGDSGGPVAVERPVSSGNWVVAGVTSFGYNDSCGLNGRSDQSYWSNISSSSNQSFIAEYLD